MYEEVCVVSFPIKVYVGFSDIIGSRIEENIKEYLEINSNSNIIKLPLLGNVNMKEVSIPLVTIILGLINGFNIIFYNRMLK